MKNFTTLSLILSMLSMASANANKPSGNSMGLNFLGLNKLTDSLKKDDTLNLGKGKDLTKGGKNKLASEEGQEAQEESEEFEPPAESETIQAAGNNDYGNHHHRGRQNGRRHHWRGYGHDNNGWSGDENYSRRHRHHGGNHDLYRRSEENSVGYGQSHIHGHHGHRGHIHGFNHDDSDWSDDDSDWHGRRNHGRSSGLYRRAEEAEAGYGHDRRHVFHGHTRHGRGYGYDDSDWSDNESDWHGPRYFGRIHHGRRHHARKHGLYRRAEEGEEGSRVGHTRRGRQYNHGHKRHFDSESDYSDSDYSNFDDSDIDFEHDHFNAKKLTLTPKPTTTKP